MWKVLVSATGKYKAGWGIREDAILGRMVRKGYPEEVTFEDRPKWSERGGHVKVWGKNIPSKGNNSAKALGQESAWWVKATRTS